MIYIIALATCVATLCGGLFAIKFRDRLHLVLGFSAGAVIGVAFFDLIPEALELGASSFGNNTIMAVVALGFIIFMLLDRSVLMHSHSCEGMSEHKHVHRRGFFGAGSLSIHSFLDGVGIGLAFQVSSAVGMIVAIAVLVHDFSDGINTVGVIIKNEGSWKQALHWLIVDAVAPALGIFSTLFFAVPDKTLGIILALFAGFFTYIGASDLLPESHHNHPTVWTTIATVCGVAVLYGAISLAGM
jgi:ZIP family zinc transporter